METPAAPTPPEAELTEREQEEEMLGENAALNHQEGDRDAGC